MPLKNSAIKTLRKAAGESNILTDPEDLYVYSLEQFFKKRHPKLDTVVRLLDAETIKRVTENAHKKGFQVIRRSADSDEIEQTGEAVVLIDDVEVPQLKAFEGSQQKAQLRTEFEKEIREGGHGTLRNYALALKQFLSGLPAQKCVNCTVCTGYCTVSSSFSGVETWSSKGRTLLAQALHNGELQPTPKLVDVLYTCSLCGLCFADCFESTQVRKAIMDTRRRLVEQKKTPELFVATAKNILEAGDPAATPVDKRVAWTERLSREKGFSKKAEVLYWTGCTVATRTPNVAAALGKILTRAEIGFIYLGEKEGCCGYPLLAGGLWKEAKENALRLVERVRETGAETLITPCAGCNYTFTKMYPEMLDTELPCQVMHASQYVEGLVEHGIIVPNSMTLKVTYHDPCSLGRHANIFEPPRKLLQAVPDLNFVEMALNRKRARCCGAGGGLWSFNNQVASNSAAERLEKDAVPLRVSAVVTACPTCQLNLRNASVKRALGIKVYDITEIVEAACSAVS